ncbi:MAG: site-2 protease family protein [Isosphaeraceae bacterium]
MDTLNWLLNILKVALGLGFVIFLHELGHFLLAKWNGVKVEKFSIGFGPTLLGFTRGETEYVLAAIPLGGFVKMLGEGPDEETNRSSDPRAYPNKTVSARMAIISAGVIMNLILGLACFVYAYGQGMDEKPARIGSVLAGSPAYEAGMLAGDDIVSIDGRPDQTFNNLMLKVQLSSPGQVVHFEVKRPGKDALIPFRIEPRREGTAQVPGIGISPSLHLILSGPPHGVPYREPAGSLGPPKTTGAGLIGKEKVVALGPAGGKLTPVSDLQDYYEQLSRHRSENLDIVFERESSAATRNASSVESVTATFLPNRFVDFGFRLKIEPISAIRRGSPAEMAGLRKGDTLVKLNGEDFDPMRLPTLAYESAGKPMTFEVRRPGAGKEPQTLSVTVTPEALLPWTEIAFPEAPLDVTGLGLAYPVRSRIIAVASGSPAANAGLKVGDEINAMIVPAPRSDKTARKPTEITLSDKQPYWPSAFQAIQLQPLEPIGLKVNNANATIVVTPAPDPTWFHPLRGLQFNRYLTRKSPPLTAAQALRRGFDDTVDNVLSIYAMFRSLAQSRVSMKKLGGPILIAQVAYDAAGQGLTDLVYFLGILSINLAVLNFLPIPPLDGGQFVFLMAEKVRGRPLPDSALIAGTYVGLGLVLSLMVFVLYQDVSRLILSYL